ncbi:MAG: hypothetical protein KGI26_00570 [Thaumarchaeota archaeon]|nr:hypothetical protein [Nitrososphaerota archaeon]
MKDGILFHAKHAYMPNSLGYCGPDENGKILGHLEAGKGGEDLVRTLQGFEAAYPFLKLIARNSGREVFDYSVPEAYWIGNDLLGRVDPADFLRFSRGELKGNGMRNLEMSLKPLDGAGVPHHTLYVLGTYAGSAGDGPSLGNGAAKKVARLMDDCRISWGTVRRADREELVVLHQPLALGDGLSLGAPAEKKVRYDPRVEPFDRVKAGDVVSIHWNYACDVLSRRQARNIERYTALDLTLANRLISADRSRRSK